MSLSYPSISHSHLHQLTHSLTYTISIPFSTPFLCVLHSFILPVKKSSYLFVNSQVILHPFCFYTNSITSQATEFNTYCYFTNTYQTVTLHRNLSHYLSLFLFLSQSDPLYLSLTHTHLVYHGLTHFLWFSPSLFLRRLFFLQSFCLFCFTYVASTFDKDLPSK